MPTYPWTTDPPPPIPPPLEVVPPPRHGRIDGTLDAAVEWLLRKAGLLAVLDQVTGDGPALHAAAESWRDGALDIREVSLALREGGAAAGTGWDGAAAESFGALMNTYVAIVDDLCANAGAIADVVNRAGIACALAERLVTEIVADAAAWAAAEVAATAVADMLTLGVATVAGAVAESATLALFVERAARVSTGLAVTLDELAAELASLTRARAAIRAADGFAKLRALRDVRWELGRLPVMSQAVGLLEATVDTVIGESTGLPLSVTGVKSPALIIGQDVGNAGHDYLTTKRNGPGNAR